MFKRVLENLIFPRIVSEFAFFLHVFPSTNLNVGQRISRLVDCHLFWILVRKSLLSNYTQICIIVLPSPFLAQLKVITILEEPT